MSFYTSFLYGAMALLVAGTVQAAQTNQLVYELSCPKPSQIKKLTCTNDPECSIESHVLTMKERYGRDKNIQLKISGKQSANVAGDATILPGIGGGCVYLNPGRMLPTAQVDQFVISLPPGYALNYCRPENSSDLVCLVDKNTL